MKLELKEKKDTKLNMATRLKKKEKKDVNKNTLVKQRSKNRNVSLKSKLEEKKGRKLKRGVLSQRYKHIVNHNTKRVNLKL